MYHDIIYIYSIIMMEKTIEQNRWWWTWHEDVGRCWDFRSHVICALNYIQIRPFLRLQAHGALGYSHSMKLPFKWNIFFGDDILWTGRVTKNMDMGIVVVKDGPFANRIGGFYAKKSTGKWGKSWISILGCDHDGLTITGKWV